jgi:hypothetical protein
MAGMSPTDYQRASGFRRSSARGPVVEQRQVYAYSVHDLQNPDDPALAAFLRGGREGLSGIAVSDRLAMRNSVFYRGTSLISGSMGMLPVSLMRRTPDGKTEKAVDHPLYSIFKLDPLGNGAMSPSEFKSYMQLAALLDGNVYARVVRLNGEIQAIMPFPRKNRHEGMVGGQSPVQVPAEERTTGVSRCRGRLSLPRPGVARRIERARPARRRR